MSTRASIGHGAQNVGWSIEGFGRFWQRPDADLVAPVLTRDVVGYWPGRVPVRGIAEYTKAIADLIQLLPDLKLEVAEHAANGDVVFIRWIMRATGTKGFFEMTGIDRIRLRNGLVAENLIRFDSAEFLDLSGCRVPER